MKLFTTTADRVVKLPGLFDSVFLLHKTIIATFPRHSLCVYMCRLLGSVVDYMHLYTHIYIHRMYICIYAYIYKHLHVQIKWTLFCFVWFGYLKQFVIRAQINLSVKTNQLGIVIPFLRVHIHKTFSIGMDPFVQAFFSIDTDGDEMISIRDLEKYVDDNHLEKKMVTVGSREKFHSRC